VVAGGGQNIDGETMDQPLRILSLGAGVQSSTVLLMSCKGLLPKLDAAIFADTQWEPPQVYGHLAWLEEEAAKAGIPVHRVMAGNLRQHTVDGWARRHKGDGHRYASLPLYVSDGNGIMGTIRRQCTQEYKIVPIERFIRRNLLGLPKGQVAPVGAVEQWYGISADEQRRIRMSDQHWKRNIYPLCNLPPMLPKMFTRTMCLDWCRENYPGRNVPRSSCMGCPFHSNAEWREIKKDPVLWEDVCRVDEAIRHADRMKGEVFLHRSFRPLREANLDEDQMRFNWNEECMGLCGN